jgi:hypothetical protein
MKLLLFILVFITNLYSQNIYLKNIEYPTNVYTNQIFKLKVKATIVVDDFDEIQTNFLDSKNISLLNPNSKWKIKSNTEFYNTYIFKAQDKHAKLPVIEILLKDKQNNIKYTKQLLPPTISFNSIAIDDELFSKVIAQDVKISHQNTKQYNNKELLSVIKLEATNSNLEDFHLNKYLDQGLEEFEEKENYKAIYYYLVLPRDTQTIRFKYYNTNKNSFVTIEIPIELNDELISTQTDLNPKNSKLLLYQKIILIFIAMIFIIIYIKKRRKLYIIISIISIVILLLLLIPNKTIIIPSNTRVYILPLKHSSIFITTTKKQEVEILKSTRGFTKIILKNQKIGWIKQ